ncbi:MAG: glycosyltransferase [Eubacteriales bacterium]|nr:glycosyltransferase [Eubacteriales bacterium]
MPKVSIIIPTYNVEMYLDQCMESVQRQTLQDIEIICINDGSKDSSLSILQKYAENDARIIIIDKENGGYGKAMNMGLDRATGEYIGIVEPDDFVPLNMYEDLYKVASENDLDFVKADFYRFTTEENGNMNQVYNHLDKSGLYYNQVYNPSEMPILTKFIMNTWSGIYRRKYIEENHIRHNETPGASFQDNGFFWQTFIYAKRAMFLDKPYYMNRRDNPNSSVNSKEKVYCMNIEYDHIRDIFMQKENKELWEKFKGYYNLKRYHNYMFTITRISDVFKREYVERIAAEFRRSNDLGELDMSLFTKLEQEKLAFMMKQPGDYYLKYCLYGADISKKMQSCEKKLEKAEKRVKELENSTTFKVGRIIMFIPIAIKKALKKILK